MEAVMPPRRLSWAEVCAIRADPDIDPADIAIRHGLCKASVYRILRQHTYKLARPPGPKPPKTGPRGWRKLDWPKVRRIRCLHEDGACQADIARQFQVCPGTVWHIVTHATWKENNT
jgi:hypothetical protein